MQTTHQLLLLGVTEMEFMYKAWPIVATVLSTAAGCIALFIGYLNYQRKSGLRLRGNYTLTTSRECPDQFISQITLENLKDRAITIFGIYLKLGYNTYLLIDEFTELPLVLRPFETFQRDYDPIDFYSTGSRRVQINQLLRDDRVRKRLMISTSDGKYAVRRYIRAWDPVHTFFRNHMTAIIRPIRSIYKGAAYGSNAIFLVELKLPDGADQNVPIYPDDYRVRRFRNVQLTQESLQSKVALETFLNAQRNAGKLDAQSIRVHDLNELRNERFSEEFRGAPVQIPRIGAFKYYVLGSLLTRVNNSKTRRANKKLARQNQKRAIEHS